LVISVKGDRFEIALGDPLYPNQLAMLFNVDQPTLSIPKMFLCNIDPMRVYPHEKYRGVSHGINDPRRV
jgi:hypothetical protein